MIRKVLRHFTLDTADTIVQPFGTGLINNTWLVSAGDRRYILQRINEKVFRNPGAIDQNISAIGIYLKKNSPGYLFTSPIVSNDNETLVSEADGSFRLFKFIEKSRVYTVLQNPELAFEAARQFGKFTRLLAGFDVAQLKITLPDFHNLVLRHEQFEKAVTGANGERLSLANQAVKYLKSQYNIVETFCSIKVNPDFKLRVTHHDTKISNVLFDENNKGICVIDLDTVMPGYFISDVGDMMRTYLSPADEEETELDKIEVREDYFDAIVKGYLSEMQNELTNTEKKYFVYAGKFMVYMQALRFLTDFLNNDVYYGARYPLHNFSRALNQVRLLEILLDKEDALKRRVRTFLQ